MVYIQWYTIKLLSTVKNFLIKIVNFHFYSCHTLVKQFFRTIFFCFFFSCVDTFFLSLLFYISFYIRSVYYYLYYNKIIIISNTIFFCCILKYVQFFNVYFYLFQYVRWWNYEFFVFLLLYYVLTIGLLSITYFKSMQAHFDFILHIDYNIWK